MGSGGPTKVPWKGALISHQETHSISRGSLHLVKDVAQDIHAQLQ